MNYISVHEPTISDDFSGGSSQWVLSNIYDVNAINTSIQPERQKFWISDGELFVSDGAVSVKGSSSNDYVIEVNLRNVNHGKEQGIIFNNRKCAVYIDGPFVEIICDGKILHRSDTYEGKHHLRVIVKGPNIAVYVDKRLLHSFTIDNPGVLYLFSLYADLGSGNIQNIAGFSNFKFWNITNLE